MPILHNRSPYELLFGCHPDYSQLKVFGCACYPFLGPYKKDNLYPKSKRYAFLCYNNMNKRYKCLKS